MHVLPYQIVHVPDIEDKVGPIAWGPSRKLIGNAAYIVHVTSLAILRTVTVRRKLAGVTNDKESVLIAVREPCLSG